MTVCVLIHSFATAEGPKKKNCNSPSTHMDSFAPATKTQGTKCIWLSFSSLWRDTCGTQLTISPQAALVVASISIRAKRVVISSFFFLLLMFGPQIWCFLSQLLPTLRIKTFAGTKSTLCQQWALWRNRTRVIEVVGKENRSPLCSDLDYKYFSSWLVWKQDGESIEIPQEAKTGRPH